MTTTIRQALEELRDELALATALCLHCDEEIETAECSCFDYEIPGATEICNRLTALLEICESCDGRGTIWHLFPNGGGYENRVCPECNGTGKQTLTESNDT